METPRVCGFKESEKTLGVSMNIQHKRSHMASILPMKSLLEAGVHFGHRTRRWNPRMKQFIFTQRNGIHIIDLQQTMSRLEEAYKITRDAVAEGGTILFVGTKKQAQETVQ